MKFIWSSYEIISYEYGHLISYELHMNFMRNYLIIRVYFLRNSYEVRMKSSYVIMCEISKWPWFSYVFHSKFIWHTDQNFQMKFHTNDTNRPSYIPDCSLCINRQIKYFFKSANLINFNSSMRASVSKSLWSYENSNIEQLFFREIMCFKCVLYVFAQVTIK